MPVGLRRHGADQRECPPGSEARCRSGLTGPWCEPRIPKTCSPATNRTLIYGMGFYTPLWWMCCPCMPCRRNGRILLANLLQCSKSTFFSGKFPQLFCLQRRYVEHTNFATWGFANSIRAFMCSVSAHRAHGRGRLHLATFDFPLWPATCRMRTIYVCLLGRGVVQHAGGYAQIAGLCP
jgi:hypothetical protein